MKINTSTLIFTSFLLLASVNIGSSLKCYKCTAPFEHGYETCKITEEEGPFEECESYQVCVAYHHWPTTLEIAERRPGRMIRGCFEENYCKEMVEASMLTYASGLGQCYNCNTDLCNSGFGVIPSVTTITFLIAIKCYFF